MVTEISIKCNDGSEIVECKPFRMTPILKCNQCGADLKEEEQFESTYRFYSSNGVCVGVRKVYLCFNCIEVLTGRRL